MAGSWKTTIPTSSSNCHFTLKEIISTRLPKQHYYSNVLLNISVPTITKTLINYCNQKCHITLHNTHNISRDTQIIEAAIKINSQSRWQFNFHAAFTIAAELRHQISIMLYSFPCQAHTRQHIHSCQWQGKNLSILRVMTVLLVAKKKRKKKKNIADRT